MIRRPPRSTLFPSRRSSDLKEESVMRGLVYRTGWAHLAAGAVLAGLLSAPGLALGQSRSEEHTSELQSLAYLVCRLLLEKKTEQTARRLQGTANQHSCGHAA